MILRTQRTFGTAIFKVIKNSEDILFGLYFVAFTAETPAISKKGSFRASEVTVTEMFGIVSGKKFSAVILAGGLSTRMGGVSKQQYVLCGLPVVVHTMQAFEKCPECREIIVVSRKDECTLYPTLCEKYAITKFCRVLPGGETRQESALIGAEGVSADAEYIAIHDAARCLVTPAQIREVFLKAVKYRCATASCKATDTVKLISADGKTHTTGQPERENLRYMQTPQIFYADLYRAAAYTAKNDGFSATDDCSLLEHAGFGVKTVDCGSENIKITSPVDFVIAEAILHARNSQK